MKILTSIWSYKCPRCRSSSLYTSPFNIKRPLDMPKACSHCEQRFEPEPGFYFGAMFISYALCTLGMLPLALFLVFYFKWSVVAAMSFVVIFWFSINIRMLRLSRSIWIHIVVRYNPDLAANSGKESWLGGNSWISPWIKGKKIARHHLLTLSYSIFRCERRIRTSTGSLAKEQKKNVVNPYPSFVAFPPPPRQEGMATCFITSQYLCKYLPVTFERQYKCMANLFYSANNLTE